MKTHVLKSEVHVFVEETEKVVNEGLENEVENSHYRNRFLGNQGDQTEDENRQVEIRKQDFRVVFYVREKLIAWTEVAEVVEQ